MFSLALQEEISSVILNTLLTTCEMDVQLSQTTNMSSSCYCITIHSAVTCGGHVPCCCEQTTVKPLKKRVCVALSARKCFGLVGPYFFLPSHISETVKQV